MASETESVKEPGTVAQEAIKLHDYELTVVISPEDTEEKLESRIDSISQYITGHRGAIDSLDRWGKRRLTYSIKNALEGNYVLFRMKLPPEASRELEASLKISEDVLRHMLVRVDR
ncbi:MAG: 30S ribosomal protein S6 [Chloroflexota bacterium]